MIWWIYLQLFSRKNKGENKMKYLYKRRQPVICTDKNSQISGKKGCIVRRGICPDMPSYEVKFEGEEIDWDVAEIYLEKV